MMSYHTFLIFGCRDLRFLVLSWKTLILHLATISTTAILTTNVGVLFAKFYYLLPCLALLVCVRVSLYVCVPMHVYMTMHCVYIIYILIDEEQTHCFDAANVHSSSIVAAASLVARAAYTLAGGKDPSALNSIKINASLVEELLGCLLDCKPGLSCGLVKHYISPSATCPSHYVGVIVREPSSALYPPYAGDISRFVWNFLADKTSVPSKNLTASCPKNCNGDGELCVGAEPDGKGVCIVSTTRYLKASL